MRRLAFLAALALAGCGSHGGTSLGPNDLSIESKSGTHVFHIERARTEAEQGKGLAGRTELAKDAGMLFAPYPPGGEPPHVANFWMKNTAIPLDMIFIRPDHTIAKIAERTVPNTETFISSGEPVTAILEVNAGRAAELGLAAGDKVNWTAN